MEFAQTLRDGPEIAIFLGFAIGFWNLKFGTFNLELVRRTGGEIISTRREHKQHGIESTKGPSASGAVIDAHERSEGGAKLFTEH